MKIAFITGCIEPGKDGVGDYTRRLAAECIRQGNGSIIVALNDPYVAAARTEEQESEGTSVHVVRLPRTGEWRDRARTAREWMNEFDPAWISLQFVLFGLHRRGLPFGVAGHLATIIGSRPLHCMFHELWVLWKFPFSWRIRLLGQAQKLCLWYCAKKLRPAVITTQLSLYQAELEKIGVRAALLPLHGNIPVHPGDEADQWLANRCEMWRDTKMVRAGFFGNILPTLDVSLLKKQVNELSSSGQPLLLLSAGKVGGEGFAVWESLKQRLKDSATFVALGELNEREVSLYFSALNYGLTHYPVELMGKSGTVAAMREHNLPVISCGILGPLSEQGIGSGRSSKLPKERWTVRQSVNFLLQQFGVPPVVELAL